MTVEIKHRSVALSLCALLKSIPDICNSEYLFPPLNLALNNIYIATTKSVCYFLFLKCLLIVFRLFVSTVILFIVPTVSQSLKIISNSTVEEGLFLL